MLDKNVSFQEASGARHKLHPLFELLFTLGKQISDYNTCHFFQNIKSKKRNKRNTTKNI